MENQRYWHHLKCSNCATIESIAGPLKSEMAWQEFAILLRKSPEMNPHYRYCKSCKKMTHTTLIAFDAE
jgi:hypothetical protein